VYLILRYDTNVNKIDRVLKGLCMAIVFSACLQMSLASGGCFNPALGIAQSVYAVILDNRDNSSLGSDNAVYMWPYIVFPFVGALFAAVIYLFHYKLLNKKPYEN